jgi:hypothetical protein
MVYVGGAVFQDPKDQAGLIALKTNKGALTNPEWTVPVTTTMEASGSWFGVASSPQVVGGIVYFAALDGKVYAVQG